jgi:hypothetical protein
MSTVLKLSLTSADGLQSFKTDVSHASCESTCAYVFNAAGANWIWREGAVYKWQIKGFGPVGELVAKSVKGTFTVDMRGPLVLTGPTNGVVIDTTHPGPQDVSLQWQRSGYDKFRVIAYKANGDIYSDSGWISEGTVCISNSCARNTTFSAPADGKTKSYSWRVLGKIQFVSGTTKSEKRGFTLFTSTP